MNEFIFYVEEGRLLWIWDEDKGGVYGYCRFYG